MGSMPCPSWTAELASKTLNGIAPWANSVTKIRCGPDSGISPVKPAISSTIHPPARIAAPRCRTFVSKCIPIRAPSVHRKTRGACFLATCRQRCSSRKWSVTEATMKSATAETSTILTRTQFHSAGPNRPAMMPIRKSPSVIASVPRAGEHSFHCTRTRPRGKHSQRSRACSSRQAAGTRVVRLPPNTSTRTPVARPKRNRMPISIIPWRGISASMTKASSPLVAIMAATSAPRVRTPWE
jgi:hypothetical protein